VKLPEKSTNLPCPQRDTAMCDFRSRLYVGALGLAGAGGTAAHWLCSSTRSGSRNDFGSSSPAARIRCGGIPDICQESEAAWALGALVLQVAPSRPSRTSTPRRHPRSRDPMGRLASAADRRRTYVLRHPRCNRPVNQVLSVFRRAGTSPDIRGTWRRSGKAQISPQWRQRK